MRIVVTGGAGFIGSAVVDRSVAAGHEVLVVDNLWEHGGGRREHVPAGVRFVSLDVRDEAFGPLLGGFRPDVVCHHAAQHSVAIGSRDPKHDTLVNTYGMLNVLEASVAAGVKKFVFAGSGATYGEPASVPIDEETPQRPAGPYGITKLAGEHYLRFFKEEHGLEFVSFRYGNVYGPRQDPAGEAGVVGIFIGNFLAHQDVRIDWDGEQTRDYVFVGDVAEANVAAFERGSGFYVLGTGQRTSVNQVYRALVELTGYEPGIVPGAKRPGDVRDALFNADRARRELGWTPKVGLEEGLRRTLAYMRDARVSAAAA
jgi:UDP-glucose 4-epimerase